MAAEPMPVWGQWNGTNPVWTNSNVGIGTSSPGTYGAVNAKLDVNGAFHTGGNFYGSNLFVAAGDYTNTVNGAPWYGVGQSYLNFGGGVVQVAGWGGLNFQTSAGQLVIRGDSGNVGIGTTNPQYKLAVNGNIGAQDIIVTNTGWSDYVFRPGYRLRPLSEVSQFIQANGHLPDIPTETEVKEKGVSLGDMQAKLLAKVEELTLHMIQQEKENRELRDQVQELREHLARPEKRAASDLTPAAAK